MEAADFYYLHYKTLSVEELVKRINTQSLRDGIESCITSESDVMLIHAIYRLSCDTKMYRKREIRDYLWSKIAPQCSVSFGCSLEEYKNGYMKLFGYCWRQWFIPEGHIGKRLSKIVYSNRSFWMKVVSNNIMLFFFVVAFVWLQYRINICFAISCKFEWILFLIVAWTSAIISTVAKNSYWFPMICLVIYVILAIINIFSPMISAYQCSKGIDIAKALIYKLFSFLLWYPALLLNSERINDCYE